MRSYAMLMGLMAGLFLGCFGLFQLLDLSILSDPGPWLTGGGRWSAGAASLALLVLDVFLPVPASLVMVANGALFGVTFGTLLSLLGGVTASAVAFAVGRWGSDRIHRWVSEDDRQRADAMLERWGELAVVVTRPVPILAESLAILAGTSTLSWTRFLVAATLGNLPVSLLYALTGATAARLDNAYLVFGLVMVVASLVWLVGRRRPASKRSRLDAGT